MINSYVKKYILVSWFLILLTLFFGASYLSVNAGYCPNAGGSHGVLQQTCTKSNCSKSCSCSCGTSGCVTSYTCVGSYTNTCGYWSGSCNYIRDASYCNENMPGCPAYVYSSCTGGAYCNGSATGTIASGQKVCGGGPYVYRCSDGTWVNEGTSCVLCSPPTITASSCSAPGSTINIGWNAVAGATSYALRVDDLVDGWNPGACNGWNGNDFCLSGGWTALSWTGQTGHSYNWWVHSCDALNCSTQSTSSFTCFAPVNGQCGGTNNVCNVGTLSDTADSPTQYLWSCVGAYGGSTASCSQYIPITGQCGGTLNSCSAGTLSDTADSPSQYLWSCVGAYGGSTASCFQNIPTATPTPTPVLVPYYKMKDTSFYKIDTLSQNFPAAPTRYDASDTGSGWYFNQGQSGVVMTSGASLSAGAGGTDISGSSSNIRNWTALNYSGGNTFLPASFLNYVRAKKSTTSKASFAALSSSVAGGTYSVTSDSNTVTTIGSTPDFQDYITIIITGTLNLNVADLGKNGVTFIVNGPVNINGSAGTFNSSNRPFAVISTGLITFADALTEADGLFVGNTVAFGSGVNPLKIVGNVSTSSSTFSRNRGTAAASMFIVFDPRHYMSIVDKVSTVKSTWTESQ